MRLHSRAGQGLLGAALVGALMPACYSAGSGGGPPPDGFYFPVGLAVARDGDLHDATAPMVLYVVNSDFDLQFNGGTLQSYDLRRLRRDAAQLVTTNLVTQDPSLVLGGDNPPPV